MTDAANGVPAQQPEALAETMYVAYFNDFGGQLAHEMVTWTDLLPELKAHWLAAARAAVGYFWPGDSGTHTR
jgi:hypothetical protein